MNPKAERRLEIYNEFVSTLRATKGGTVKVDELDELYGEGWRKDLERIVSVDEEVKAAGDLQSFLSPGLFALDAEEKERKVRIEERLSDKPRLRKAQRAFIVEFFLVIAFAALALWIASIFVPLESPHAETISASIFIAAIGASVASYQKYRKTLFD